MWQAFLALLLAVACQTRKEEPSKERPRVTVEPLTLKAWEERISVPVTAMPASTVHVVAKVPGRVEKVMVDEGDEVSAGDVLLVLDQKDLRLAVRQAEGQVALARAGLQAALVQRDMLAKDLQRFRELAKTQSVAKGDMEKIEAQYDAAVAQVEIAEAQARVAEVAYAMAKHRLEDAVVRSPVDGLIVKRGVDQGQETAPTSGNPLVVVASVDPIRVEGSVPEYLWHKLNPGMDVEVSFDGVPGQVFQGKVSLVGPTVDPMTRQVRLRVEIPNPKHSGKRRIAPGMSGLLQIVPVSGQYFVIPMNAVRREEDDGRLVLFFVDRENRVYEKAIKAVRKEGLNFLALDGLSEGENLVTAGPKELAAGQIVEVIQK